MIWTKNILTPIGNLQVFSTNKGICLIGYPESVHLNRQITKLKNKYTQKSIHKANTHIDQLTQELNEYFAKKRTTFTVAIDLNGTEFQQQAWQALTTIPYGQTRSYKQQAQILQNPKAIQAIGSANGKNPISILIPCHRVIATNKKLTGYAGGLWRKKYLLELEGYTDFVE